MKNNGKITSWATIILLIVAGCIFIIARSNLGETEIPATETPTATAPVVTSPSSTTDFTDPSGTFSFQYPSIATLSGNTRELGIDWRENTTRTGMLLAKVTVPGVIQPHTNLADSRFTVGTSSDAMAVKNCLSDTPNGAGKGTKVTINGVEFTKLAMSDAGAGNLYETTSYRTVQNDQCYAVEYTIHSTQLANYPVELGIQAYDKTAITELFEGIVQSFKFL